MLSLLRTVAELGAQFSLHCEEYLLLILGSFRLEEILSVAFVAVYAKSDALNFRRAPWRI